MSYRSRRLDVTTLCAHAGEPSSVGVGAGARAHVSPLYQQTVFDFATVAESSAAIAGGAYVYRRNGMPNADELGAAVAALEGAPAGQATSSGMGAIAALVMGHCSAGDRVIVQRDAYGGTPSLLGAELARFGLVTEPADVYDVDELAPRLEGARMLLVESISNPLLRRVSVAALAERCRAAGCLLAVDNTFATPLACQPLALGADLVVHSATKFLGGHHDACAGAVCGATELVARVGDVCKRFGLVASPLDAWLAVRGVRTLAVRMARSWQTAAELAVRLRDHDGTAAVYSADCCALVSFDVGSFGAAERVVERCRLVTLSPSLGGVTTTLSHPASSSHVALSAAERRAAGIGDGLLRLCVGLEHVDDVWRDLAGALAG